MNYDEAKLELFVALLPGAGQLYRWKGHANYRVVQCAGLWVSYTRVPSGEHEPICTMRLAEWWRLVCRGDLSVYGL